MFHFCTLPQQKMSESQRFSGVNMAKSVTKTSRQLFCYVIMKIYQIWWLSELGVPPKSLDNFFYGAFRAFVGWRSLRVKNQLYQTWSYYIPLECKLYTDLKMQKNLCLKINIWDGFTALLILFASHIWLHRPKNKITKCSGKKVLCRNFKIQPVLRTIIFCMTFVYLSQTTVKE